MNLGDSVDYGSVRDEINSDATCFSGVNDGHYSGCDTVSPILISASTVSATGPITSLTYTGELEEANSCLCFGKPDGGLACTDPFELKVEYPCSFTEATIDDLELIYDAGATDISHSFGNIRDRICTNADYACFAETGHGQYTDCDQAEKVLLTSVSESSFTGPESIMTYLIEGDATLTNTCLCFEKSIGGLACTAPFNQVFKQRLEPCEASLVHDFSLIYSFTAPPEGTTEIKEFPTSSEAYVSKPQGQSASKCAQ